MNIKKIGPSSLFSCRSQVRARATESPEPPQGDSFEMSCPTDVAPGDVAAVKREYQEAEIVPGELIVKVRSSEAMLVARQVGASIAETFDFPGLKTEQVVRLKVSPDKDLFQLLADLRADERVGFAEPNLVFRLQEKETSPISTPNDLDPRLWGLKNEGQTGGKAGADISVEKAWAVSTGGGVGKGPLIAVIDSGIDLNHPDIWPNLWKNPGEHPGDGIDNDGNGVIDDVHGYNAFDDNGDPSDGLSHGTHVAGTIGAVGNNGQGITGVMQEAQMMAVKIFSDEGRTSTDVILRGILYSQKMGARLTSNSWGGPRFSQAIYDAFASHSGLHVVAAGNSAYDNDRHDQFPANFDLPNIVTVAATNHIDQRAGFSQWGATKVDVAAPGENILSTIPGGGYATKSGTSMATPHVTGGAGLILSAYPEATNEEIKQRLIFGSDRFPAMLGVSASDGRLNLGRSLEDDNIPPGAPNDFQISQVGTRGGIVSWTSVGDDKWSNGAAPLVFLERSDRPFTGDSPEEVTLHKLEGAGEVGELATFAFKSVPSEESQPVYFSLQSLDNVGNRSEVRFAQAVVPAADVVTRDSFDTESKFQGTGDFQRVDFEGRGGVFSSKPGVQGSAALSVLNSPEIDLTGRENAFLKFDFQTDLERSEWARIWASSDGENWTREAILRKSTDGWTEQGVDISEYDGQKVFLKFVVNAKEGGNQGTLMVDNFRVLSEPATKRRSFEKPIRLSPD